MRRALLILLLVLAVAGCALPRAERPVGASVNLVLEDARPASRTPFWDASELLIYVVPVVPWLTTNENPFPQRSLAPELAEATRDTGLFTRVLGPGDPWPDRLAATHTLRVVLFETEQHRRRTTYGLGIVGLLLHALGAPQDYESTTIALRVTCTTNDGTTVCDGDASEGDLGLTWIYEDRPYEDSAVNLRDTVRAALGEALAPLLTD